MALLEICVDSYESCLAAIAGGADRLELCAALSEGGLTPSVGLLREVRHFLMRRQEGNRSRQVQLYAMVRCRRGSDFRYSEPELRIMLEDMRLLAESGADGFVFGALTDGREIQLEQCGTIVEEAKRLGKVVTFHRAFDCTDPARMGENLKRVAELGFSTVLTSGFESTAERGLDNLVRLVELAEEIPISIMPGSGVSPSNARSIVQLTGCKAIHASARSAKSGNSGALSMGGSVADGEGLLVCNQAIVEAIRNQIKF